MENIRKERKIVFSMSFLFTLSAGLTMYTNSSFLEELFGAQKTGLIYAIGSTIAIIILLRSAHSVRTMGNRSIFLLYSILHIVSLLALALHSHPILSLVSFVLYFASGYVLVFSLDIFFQHVIAKKNKGLSRSVFLLLTNGGRALSPFIAISLVGLSGYAGTYIAALCVFSIIALFVGFFLRKYHDSEYKEEHLRTTFEHVQKRPTLKTVVLTNFLLNFFFSWIVVYTPIYLLKYLGFEWSQLGVIFAIALAPFVILDYPLGLLAKKLGSEKELSAIGFAIIALAVFLIPMFTNPSIWTIGALLILSRIGAATVEAMTEIHFFKIVDESEPGILSIFRDLKPLSYLVGPLTGTIVLLFLPFKWIFIILGIIMILGFFISFNLEVNHTWWKRSHSA